MDQVGLVEAAGIVFVLGYIGWLIAFFEVVRPRLMRRSGRRLGVKVREGHGAFDAGFYDTADDAPFLKSGVVVLWDFALLFAATVGMAALVGIPAFLFVESGAAYRLEGTVLRTGTRIRAAVVAPMRGDTTTADVTIENGPAPAASCRLDLADYTAANGYLTGHSDYFDLAAGERRVVRMTLDASRRVPGTHRVRIDLECRNRLKDRSGTVVVVE